MPEKSRWPFGEANPTSGRALRRHPDQSARIADQATYRQRARFDRLLVGGRAHTKRHGLS